MSVELVCLRKNRQQQVQKQIPCGNDGQKGKGKNKQQQVPIRGSFASAAKARPQAQDDGEKQATATACWLRFYFPTLATMKLSRTWGTRAGEAL